MRAVCLLLTWFELICETNETCNDNDNDDNDDGDDDVADGDDGADNGNGDACYHNDND